jgi:hypothetical protein
VGGGGTGPTPATGELGGVTFTAVDPGEAGNDIEIVFVASETAKEELSITVSDNKDYCFIGY